MSSVGLHGSPTPDHRSTDDQGWLDWAKGKLSGAKKSKPAHRKSPAKPRPKSVKASHKIKQFPTSTIYWEPTPGDGQYSQFVKTHTYDPRVVEPKPAKVWWTARPGDGAYKPAPVPVKHSLSKMAALPAASHSPLTQHQVSKAAQHTFSAKKATTSPEPPRKSSASKAASVATKSLDMHHSASSASRHATSPPHVASQASITLRSDGRPRISTISHQVSKSLPSGGLATRATGPSVSSRTSAQPARPVCSVNCTPSHTATSYSALSNAKSKASAQTSVRPALSGPPEAVRQTHHPLTIHDSASSARFGPAGQLQAQSHTHSSSAATSGASVSRSETIPKHKNEAASASSRPASQLTIHPSALQDSSISLRTGHPPIASAGSAIASGATNASATRASSLITSVTGSQGLRSSQTARRSDMSSADSQTNIVQTSAQGGARSAAHDSSSGLNRSGSGQSHATTTTFSRDMQSLPGASGPSSDASAGALPSEPSGSNSRSNSTIGLISISTMSQGGLSEATVTRPSGGSHERHVSTRMTVPMPSPSGPEPAKQSSLAVKYTWAFSSGSSPTSTATPTEGREHGGLSPSIVSFSRSDISLATSRTSDAVLFTMLSSMIDGSDRPDIAGSTPATTSMGLPTQASPASDSKSDGASKTDVDPTPDGDTSPTSEALTASSTLGSISDVPKETPADDIDRAIEPTDLLSSESLQPTGILASDSAGITPASIVDSDSPTETSVIAGDDVPAATLDASPQPEATPSDVPGDETDSDTNTDPTDADVPADPAQAPDMSIAPHSEPEETPTDDAEPEDASGDPVSSPDPPEDTPEAPTAPTDDAGPEDAPGDPVSPPPDSPEDTPEAPTAPVDEDGPEAVDPSDTASPDAAPSPDDEDTDLPANDMPDTESRDADDVPAVDDAEAGAADDSLDSLDGLDIADVDDPFPDGGVFYEDADNADAPDLLRRTVPGPPDPSRYLSVRQPAAKNPKALFIDGSREWPGQIGLDVPILAAMLMLLLTLGVIPIVHTIRLRRGTRRRIDSHAHLMSR